MTACSSRNAVSRHGSSLAIPKCRHRVAYGVVAALALAVASSRATAGTIVYGNLGASGTNSVGSTTVDINGTSTPVYTALAQGFTTGNSLLTIESAKLGLFATTGTPVARTVSIWTDSGGSPGTKTFTSAFTNVGDVSAYSFSFSGATLSANTPYWLIPDTGLGEVLSWYVLLTNPSAQNGSGYSFVGTKSSAGSGTWNPLTFPGPGVTVSLTASDPGVVPEIDPNAIGGAMAFVTGALGWLERRRLARR